MTGRLDGRVAIITGAASGIGRATTLRFLAEGAAVVGTDLNADGLASLAAEADHERLLTRQADVASEADHEVVVAEAVDRFGGLHVIFNNAGLGGAFGPLTEISVEHWDRTFAVLTRGVFLGTKHAARAMIAAGTGGSIVNTASIAGLGGGAGPPAYSAAKAAVISLTRTAAEELGRHGIRVNGINPGLIHTPLAVPTGDEEFLADLSREMQLIDHLGHPDDIAEVALFLASDESRFVTGETITADGGVIARGPAFFRRMDRRGSTERNAGFAHGTTGRPPEKRKLSSPFPGHGGPPTP